MSILFIADVHLCNTKPKIIHGFLNFLYNHAMQAQALYILGDLFEVWLGDDEKNIMHMTIAKGLQSLHKKKVPCYFIRGNHDFLLGPKYANLCDMILLPDSQVLKLPSGKNVVILHGDTLCIDDKSYQRLRNFLHCQILQKIFLSLPLSMRLYIFNCARTFCIKYKKYKLKQNLHIKLQTVIDMLIKNQSKILIHGHTHQPAIHNIQISENISFKRIVLGQWNKYGSVATINEKNDDINLIHFPLNKQ
ncbi:UDP-2,3-diacylglucosamine hydrolase [Candidatus Blochmanniella floridana]|uniref:UDP-2,3-diacylglucosamine hydrolase n=1 Tax=Blochmanniella floridana TaxID=203907 RepID=LPXH_BLOFL|nr:RecName: Full=UDP-2,3-diacylglucosamine hydrolase; AltName: Full=UDP-2,3-diacylglucosamine diphosphatase [Candidatus Blochmannia floridanus]CAD83374.1 UDP-2,3-diacylglucosamine hydrolase [Candidatus Blochmannia floridanus]